MEHIVRFYFSFRSPYAWLAAERWQVELGRYPQRVERVPFFPTRETFPNDPTLLPAKYRYVVADLRRLTREFGLTLRPPPALDTDWARAHAAYLGVQSAEPSRAEAFMLEMFRARFSRGLDVATDHAISDAAARAGANEANAREAAESPTLQAEVSGNFALGQKRDGIFGAPSFVYRDELFWGHDRMRQLGDALHEAQREEQAGASA